MRLPSSGVARVLLVEDEPTLAVALADNLEGEGYQVEIAPDGNRALERWAAWKPDLVVLDVMLPGLDGLQVCRQMRALGYTTPVLFLSAKESPEERVEGLRVGGDDYLAKPFHLPEFLLRVKNLLRRRIETPAVAYEFAGHRLDFRAWTVQLKDGRKEALGEREMAILRLLVERAGEVVSRDEILDRVWGQEVFPSSRTIDNFIMRLRRLFEPDPAHPVHFHTVWGVGYRFTPNPEPRPEASPTKEQEPT